MEAAFLRLLIRRGFARLTVAEIIAEADVGRSTFYEHYRTKTDLLDRSLAPLLGALAATARGDRPPETLVPLLTHIRQNQALGRELFLPRTRGPIIRMLTRHMERQLTELVGSDPGAKPLIPPGLIALHLAEGQLALIEEWSLGRAACRVEQLAAAMCASCRSSAALLLGLNDRLPTAGH